MVVGPSLGPSLGVPGPTAPGTVSKKPVLSYTFFPHIVINRPNNKLQVLFANMTTEISTGFAMVHVGNAYNSSFGNHDSGPA